MKFYLQVAILLLFPHLLFCQSVEQDYQELVDDIYLHRYLFDTAYNASLGTRISIDSERSNTTEHWHFSTSFSGVYSNLVFGVINLDPVDTFRIRSLDDTFLDDISLSLEYKRHGSFSSNSFESYSSIKDDNSPSKPTISGIPFHINRIEGEYWIVGTNSIDVRCMYNEAFALGYRNEGQSFLFAYESPDFFGEEVELEYRGIQKIRIDLIDLKELTNGRLPHFSWKNEIVLQNNIYSGTHTLFGTGLHFLPYVELFHFPLEDNLFTAAVYGNLISPLGGFQVKPLVSTRDPYFSSVDIFWDIVPMLFDREDRQQIRNEFAGFDSGKGVLARLGAGYRYQESDPLFGDIEPSDQHSFYLAFNATAINSEYYIINLDTIIWKDDPLSTKTLFNTDWDPNEEMTEVGRHNISGYVTLSCSLFFF